MLWRTWERVSDEAPPVFHHGGNVVVAGHAQIRAVLADPDTYQPDNALDAVTPLSIPVMRVLAGYKFRLPATLANNGAASHQVIRGVVAASMGAAEVEAQRAWLTATVRDRVARLAGRDTIDLYADLVADLPLLVLARLTGLPFEDVARVKDFSAAALELFWGPPALDRQLDLAHRVGAYHRELRDLARTGGGLAAALRGVCREDEVTAALFFLLVAGQETTSQFLTLLLARLVADPALLDADPVAIVEEGLRLDPPIVTWRRVTSVDTELGGVALPAGTPLVLWLGAAGYSVAGPEFVPGQRGSRRHLSFGAGAHRCLGAQLARMESAVVVAETVPLLREYRIVRKPASPDNLSFRLVDALIIKKRCAG